MELTSNLTYNSSSQQLSPASGVLLGTMSSYGAIVSAVSFTYIALKLRLNACFKAMLGISSLINFVCTSLIITGLGIFIKNGYIFYITECRLISYSFLTMWSTLNMINFISILRYLMSYLASHTRIMSQCCMTSLVAITSVLNYGFFPTLGIILETMKAKSMATMCMDEPHFPSKPLLPVLGVSLKLIGLFIIGLACDISLYILIKRRNKVANNGGSDIVPWKSTNQPESEDLVIPLRASLVSLMLVLLSLPVFGVVLLLLTTAAVDDLIFWSFLSFNIFLSSSMPGIVIIFTIAHRHKKHQIAQLQPPSQLQFHDQSETNEANDVELQQQVSGSNFTTGGSGVGSDEEEETQL